MWSVWLFSHQSNCDSLSFSNGVLKILISYHEYDCYYDNPVLFDNEAAIIDFPLW